MPPITHIKKIEIRNLWNNQDIDWQLNKDVNILAGINGSGKTTILNLIAGTLLSKLDYRIGKMAESVKVIFNNDQYLTFNRIKGGRKQKNNSSSTGDAFSTLEQEIGVEFDVIKFVEEGMFGFQNLHISEDEFQKILGVDVISTFDHELKEYNSLKKLTDEEVKTELDLQIFSLQKKYLEYQINVGKKAIKALSSQSANKNVQNEIAYKKNLFLDTIDEMFKPTGKCIDRDQNELVFKSGKKELSPYMLSSGEKQLVIILLTALIQEDKPYVLFMDEPESSLHTDWQEKLIENILKLNNNVQIIMATHSPSIVLDGWRSRVFEVSEITK